MLHGLEGSADAGYIRSLSQSALAAGFSVSRVNLRTCGGTEGLCRTMYHSGLTSDTKFLLESLAKSNCGPVILVGFSLGGNVVLKLAGELGETNLLVGVCSVSAPIDLAASVQRLDRPVNRLYASRFLDRLRARIKRKSRISPGVYSTAGLDQVKSVWEFDDLFTAPLFGFGSALNYYQTQSAQGFLPDIRVPTLLITAKDDPLVPFESYNQSAVRDNPNVQLLATERGGHLGFLSRTKPRFWLDGQIVSWALSCVGAKCADSVGNVYFR